eukprot:SAG31_NODE_607_length_13606_cov_11.366699_11_plen_97_part_00
MFEDCTCFHHQGHSGLRHFSLKYYLVDDTIEILEVGSDKNLVKRSKVPRKFNVQDQDLRPLAPGSTETNDYMMIEDIDGACDLLVNVCRLNDCEIS